jgi:gliding motility-associated-like protein
MRKLAYFVFFLSLTHAASGNHIAGGEMYYTYVGMSGGKHEYAVTLKFYRHCNGLRDFDNSTIISVFDKATGLRVMDIPVDLERRERKSLDVPNPCITDPPRVCLEIAYYRFSIALPETLDGYLMASQVNYRINGMNNLVPGYGQVGATYTAEIPGVKGAPNGFKNHSARFIGSDLEVLCEGNRFSYSFAAEDTDGDKLRYSLCEAYQTQGGGGGSTNVSPPPPYQPIPYKDGYSGSDPLGSNVQIDPNTGIITGIAPGNGVYVITVCVEEIRNGQVIARQRKDIQVNVSSCTIAAASLLPQYTLCKESKDLALANLSNSNLITSYHWNLATAGGFPVTSSREPVFQYSFRDTGIYYLQLTVASNNICEDSFTTRILVYPGFLPDFTASGSCFQSPFQFRDATQGGYGAVNSWLWDFGEPSGDDTSNQRNPSFKYPTPGNRVVSLIATNTKGCRDTVTQIVKALDKPVINLPFRDTLICSIDTLMLQAHVVNGVFSWSPTTSMQNSQTATPVVFPKQTTTYYVTVNESGCISRDSVKVNVLDFITVRLTPDTTICRGDAALLQPQSQGLQFSWLPAASLDDPDSKSPVASPQQNTTYQVTAHLGKCQAQASVNVKVVPYPAVLLGADTLICYGSSAALQASITASRFMWSPAGTLQGATTLQPVASPLLSTAYVLTVYDTLGCPKPARDTMIVFVQPKINAFAGNDTMVVVNQPLQLNASGGTQYLWTPALHLNSNSTANPIAVFDAEVDSITYTVRVSRNGCHAVDAITIRVFRTDADIFVPSAFTPDGDGRNDLLRPLAIGIRELKSFQVFNRWGQLVFETGQAAKGWDGRVKGVAQGASVYVYVAVGITYLGQPIVRKGTVTLIRK